MLIVIILASSAQIAYASQFNQEEKKVVFIVNSSIYTAVKYTLTKYISTITGYDVLIKTWSSTNVSQLRDYLKEEYQKGEVGAVFVGNITIPRYYDPCTKEYVLLPYFYMDLSGDWKIKNGVAIHKSVGNPSIWLGIVRSTNQHGNNAAQLNRYFQKLVMYVNGKINVLPIGAGFVDDDFAQMSENISRDLNNVYPSIVYYLRDVTTSKFFKDLLDENYAMIHIIAHSNGHEFLIKEGNNGNKWGYVTAKDIDSIHPKILFYTDISCYGADFYNGAISNHFIMYGAGLGVLGATGKIYPRAMPSYYSALANGSDFGEALISYISSSLNKNQGFDKYVAMACFLGVPLLRLWEPHGYKKHNSINIDGNNELMRFAKEEGLKGTGKRGDPIIIGGYYIHENYGISLKNVTLNVKITDNYIIMRGDFMQNGIQLFNCSNIDIEKNTIVGGDNGIDAFGSSNISILANDLIMNENGINVVQGSDISSGFNFPFGYYFSGVTNIKYNLIEYASAGIFLWSSFPPHEKYFLEKIYVENNTISNFTVGGLFVWSVKNSMFSCNKIFGGVLGRYLTFPAQTGISLWYSSNNTFFGNTVKNVSCLMNISYAENNTLYGNFFYGKYVGSGVCFWSWIPGNYTWKNRWNTSTMGNYWESWANANNTNDKNRNGIVDYPYFIGRGNVDYKPLKKPYDLPNESAIKFNMPVINAILLIFIIFLAALGMYGRKNQR